MKKTLTIIATVSLMIVSLSSFTNPISNPLKEKESKVIVTSYLESISLGSDVHHKYLFCDDFEYTYKANRDKFTKRQYLKFLKDTKDFKFNCTKNIR